MDNQSPFWSIPAEELLRQLKTTSQGLTNDEALRRFTQYGANLLKPNYFKRGSHLCAIVKYEKSSPLYSLMNDSIILPLVDTLSFPHRAPII